MGVIDDDRERLARLDGLKPAGNAPERPDPGCDRVVVDTEQPRHGDGREDVLDVEAAAQPRPQLDPAGEEPRTVAVELELLGSDVGVAGCPEGQKRLVTKRAQLLREPAAVVVADVDRGRRPLALDEQPALRVEVALKGPVEVEMVLAEVGEGERAEANSVEPAQLGAVRGRLERTAPIASVEHLTEGALEVDRLRRRADRRPGVAADPAFDRAEQARPPACRGEDRVEEEGGRRLSIRAGHARDLERPRRVVEENDGSLGHRPPGVRHDQLGDVELEHPVDHERDGAALHRFASEGVAIVPLSRDTEEKRSGPDGARVVGEVGDLDRSALHDVRGGERCDDALQVHLRGESTNGPSRHCGRRYAKRLSFAAISLQRTPGGDTSSRLCSPWGGGRANRKRPAAQVRAGCGGSRESRGVQNNQEVLRPSARIAWR